MALIEYGIEDMQHPDSGKLYSNSAAAEALIVGAFNSLQGATILCYTGLYVQATGMLRGVYESAGLARTLAHETTKANKWIHSGHHYKDLVSRQYIGS